MEPEPLPPADGDIISKAPASSPYQAPQVVQQQPEYSRAEMALFSIFGRLALALVIIGSIAGFAGLAWFVWYFFGAHVRF